MVDAEDQSGWRTQAECLGDPRSEVERRPPAVGTDLDYRGEACQAGALGHDGKREALVIWHEAFGGASRFQQFQLSRDGMSSVHRLRSRLAQPVATETIE